MEHVQGNESRSTRYPVTDTRKRGHRDACTSDRHGNTHGHVTAEKATTTVTERRTLYMQLPRTERVSFPRVDHARRSLSRSRPRSSQKPWKTKKARAKKPRRSIKGTSRVLVNASSPLKEPRIRKRATAQPRRNDATKQCTQTHTHTKHHRRRLHDESDNRTADDER